MLARITTAFLALLCTVGLASAAPVTSDVPGAKDHPLLKRFEGSIIVRHSSKNFDEFVIPLERVVFEYGPQQFNDFKRLKVEGKRTTDFYRLPQNASSLEAVKNYELDLKEKGFEVLFSGSGKELDNGYGRFLKQVYTSETDYDKQNYTMAAADDYRYVALKKSAPQGDIFVAVFAAATTSSWKDDVLATGQVLARVDVIETKALDNRMVTVTAGEMAQQLSTAGRVALYGIFFDFNKTDIKPESNQTLEEIAKLLQQSPSMKLLVVGHTDAMGTFDFNKDLSERRARAVVEALSVKHGIAKERLLPFGASFAAPMAANDTEAGRAKNRRVELVNY